MHVDIDRLRSVTPRLIAKQLALPSGLMGQVVCFLMNRRNAKINASALDKLAVEPSDRVLEIGFGGGETLHQLIEKAGFVVGLDRSSDLIRRANPNSRWGSPATEQRFSNEELMLSLSKGHHSIES